LRIPHRFRLLIFALFASLALAGVATSSASAAVAVGIGDQRPETFDDPLYKQLGVKRTRYVTPWDSIRTEPLILDQWIRAAQRNGLEPHIAFGRRRGLVCPSRACRPPSIRSYTSAFRAFRAKYPEVKVIAPWNEANSDTNEAGKSPKFAAQTFNVARRYCRGCTIVGADLLDIKNLSRYIDQFKRYADRSPTIWGLHNYGDTNRFRSTGAKVLLKKTRGKVWFTETGGIVTFRTADGRTALATSESRAARAYRYLLGTLVNTDRRRIQRVYTYNWKPLPAPLADRFDAGILRADGTPRESYNVLQQYRSLIR